MKATNKILIVDDDPSNLRVLSSILKDNYTISVAKNGEKALEIIPRFRPDLILLDIIMPGQNGYEICRKLRANLNYSFIKIILVSGKGKVEERLEGYAAGADDYITKPFVREELEAKVRIFLRLKRTEEVDQIRNDILCLFSHETRTPLNSIIGPSQMILSDKDINENVRYYANLIHAGSKWLLELVNKTTTLCNLKKNKELFKTLNDLTVVIQNVIREYEKAGAEKQITFDFESKITSPISADWNHLYLVIRYIFDNAIKYSPIGGIIRIELKPDHDMILFSISDQGPGIPQERLAQLFDEFSISNVMHHTKGLGISLAIAKNVIELHNGEIEAVSEPNLGTKIIIRIPSE